MTLDLETTQARFAEERAKRMRKDGYTQYAKAAGEMVADPWTPVAERAPKTDHVRFTFMGGGWAGLLAGAELARAGIKDVRIVDRAGGFGGVWYWNRYPGLMCDTPAMLYLPLLEETGYAPTKKYVYQPEILAHCERIATQFGLYEKALFHTDVTGITWDEEHHHWRITTDRGDSYTSDFVGLGSGPLSEPKLPGIPGVDLFEGDKFHAARWDYGVTGGGPNDPALTNLADKRVGVIGTGATAIQIVDPVSASAKEAYVFQRTPSAVHARGNEEIDPDWFAELSTKPGFQRDLEENFILNWAGMWAEPFTLAPPHNVLNDTLSKVATTIREAIYSVPPDQASPETIKAAMDASDLKQLQENHAFVDETLDDADTARHLKPWYRPLCKRPTFNDTFLTAFNRSNTHLIDTDGQGVTEITAKGVVANGKEYPMDCLIFASGYAAARDAVTGTSFDVTGLKGERLADHWQDGLRTLHGMHVAGFPNLFFVQLAQGAEFASNIPTGWHEAARRIAAIVSHMDKFGHKSAVTAPAFEAAWSEMIAQGKAFEMLADCTPGLLTNEGSQDPKLRYVQGCPDGPRAFFIQMKAWLAKGEFEGLTFKG